MNNILNYLVYIILFLQCNVDGYAQKSLNLDFELSNYDKYWWYAGDRDFTISLDSIEKHSGRFSLKMEPSSNPNGNSRMFYAILPFETFAGKNVEFRGWIKTEGVKKGYAGIWFSVNGRHNGSLGYDDMNDRGLKGDNEWRQVSIKMNVCADANSMFFGGIFSGEGSAWFDGFELYINGEKYIDIVEPELKTSLSRQEIEALKIYIYPLRTYEPDGGDTKDLKVLDKLVRNSKVVALGEVSHGSSEIFKMKNRIIQYLVANNGFDVFSIEGNLPEAYKINDYIIRGEGDPKELIAGMHLWTWQTNEVLNMVEWMHRFNHPSPKIKFTGFDIQSYFGAVNELLDAFEGNKEMTDSITVLRNKLDVIAAEQKKILLG